MNKRNNRLESGSAAQMLKNFAALALFSIIALMISLITMNLIAYPVSILAISNTHLFNQLIKYGVAAGVSFFVLIRVFRRIVNLKRSGLSPVQITAYMAKRPFYYIFISLGFIIISLIIIGIIYYILSYNYYFIHRISSG